MITRALLVVLASAILLTGCESVFGKESGKRGALPGKREDVFSADNEVKPDPAVQDLVVSVGEAVTNTDWLQPGNAFNSALALSASPREAWTTSIGSGSGGGGVLAARPVVGGGRIYTVDAAGNVSALNPANGSTLWNVSVPDPRPETASIISGSGVAYADGRVVVTTSYGNVVSLDAATGKIAWQKTLPAPIRSAPFIAGGKIYVTALTNTLYELNFTDGMLGWSHTGIQENASFLGMASPTAVEDLIIVPYSSGEIFGLRRFNGRLAWEENLASTRSGGALPAMADIQGEPVIDGTRVYVASHSGRLVALDTRSGRTVWETDVGSQQTPWVAGNAIFVVTSENQLVALSRADGRVRWTVSLPRYLDAEDKTQVMSWVGPVVAGDKVWIASSQGDLRAYSPQDGREFPGFSLGAAIYLAPVVAGSTLYVLTDSGSLTAFR